MADESLAPDAGDEIKTAVSGVEAQEPENEAELISPDEGEEGEGDEAPEEIEFSFQGEKLRVPKGSLPEELATKVDQFVRTAEAETTRKMQEVADARKAVDAERTSVDKLRGLNGEILDTYSRGLTVKAELERLDKIDLNALWQSDPDQARRVSDYRSQKQAEFREIVNAVDQKEGELNRTQASETARHVDAGKQTIGRQIKDFETKHLPDVIEYAVAKLGVSKEAAARDWPLNPPMTVAVHKAMLYDRMQATAAKAAKPQPAAPANPVVPIKGKGTGNRSFDLNRDADKMSGDEWARRRNAEIARKAKG